MDLRDRALLETALPREAVNVPEWGATYYVRGLTAEERDDFEARIAKHNDSKRNGHPRLSLRALLVVMATQGADGKPVFRAGDEAALGTKSARAVNRIWDVALRLSGIGADDAEELEKNFEGGPAADSSSSSPEPCSTAPSPS